MKQRIDFLPPKYREQYATRRRKIWRLVVIVLFGLAVGATAFCQFTLRRAVEFELGAVQPQHAAALEVNAELGDLQSRLREVRDFAELYTYLRHPWPRSQILLCIARTAPPPVTLSEIRVIHETSAPRPDFVSRNRGRQPARGAPTQHKSPAARDLEQLREELDHAHTIVHVTGLTADVGQLHSYVSRLGFSPLFERAELESVESTGGADQNGPAHFELRLTVRAGYGQPGGPTGPATDPRPQHHARRTAT